MNTEDLVDFITTLEPDESHEHYWSGIHPEGGRVQAYGTLEAMLPRLIQRNNDGFGIFTCVNRLDKVVDEKGIARRKGAQVNKVRAVFADWDNPAKKPPKDMPLPPSMRVKTSLGKYHYYWLVDDDFPLDQFERAQRGIAKSLGTDPSVIDLSREMRVPGFMHTKGKPTLVELILLEPSRRYGADEVLGAFPYANNVTKLPVVWDGTLRTKTAQTVAVIHHNYPKRQDGGYNIPCPWASAHTTPSTASSTVYYPPDAQYGAGGYFKCMHAHCQQRTASDLDNWMSERVAGAIV